MKVKRTGLANGLDVDVRERQVRAAHWLGGEAIGELKVQMVATQSALSTWSVPGTRLQESRQPHLAASGQVRLHKGHGQPGPPNSGLRASGFKLGSFGL